MIKQHRKLKYSWFISWRNFYFGWRWLQSIRPGDVLHIAFWPFSVYITRALTEEQRAELRRVALQIKKQPQKTEIL